nr:FAD-dependent oxidoreductase [Agitococcus sp.]
MLYDYDVVVIGAGPAGEGAAMKLTKEGKRVAVIDSRSQVGGNCTHVGTIPSKALRQTVFNIMRYQRDSMFRRVGELSNVPLSQVLDRAHKIIEQQVAVHTRFYDRNQVSLYYGHASFMDAHTLMVNTLEGGRETITFGHAVIATGSRPYQPNDID